MKKTIYAIALTALLSVNASAQIEDGFYHFKNVTTSRYISINDTKPENYNVNVNAGTADLKGVRTYLNYDTVAVSPSCVIFVKDLGNNKYDLVGQGSSLYTMSGQRLNISIKKNGDAYKITGTASGFTKSLADGSPSSSDSWIRITSDENLNWFALPINTSDEYIGIRPDVKTSDGEYWGTIYAGFNFKLASDGMAAFYVSNAGGSGITLEQIGDEVIPAATPVLIRCNTGNPEDNKILPVIGGYEFTGINWLKGVYCSLLKVSGHTNVTTYQPLTMRVIGLSDDGQLAFVKAKESDLYGQLYLRANKAYLSVPSDAADVMTVGGYAGINSVKSNVKKTDNALYTLTGIRIPKNTTPSAGVYIRNGQKIIIK